MDVQSLEDDLVDTTQRVFADVTASSDPGRYMVDILPFLQHVPSWFPGTGWQRKAAQMKHDLNRIVEEPYHRVKESLAKGDNRKSFLSEMIKGDAGDEYSLQWITASSYAVGIDTTLAALSRFIAAMVLYPEVQKVAQDELGRIVGRSRLPTLADKDSLAHIEALTKESFRWEIIAAFGVPHLSSADDENQGYFIPKGAMILPNFCFVRRIHCRVYFLPHPLCRTISQDPQMYPEPEVFRPERFLVKDGPSPIDPREFAFGVGRRACPGRYFIDATLYVFFVTILSTCTIERPLDDDGRPYTPQITFGGTSLRATDPLPFRITARSSDSYALVQTPNYDGDA